MTIDPNLYPLSTLATDLNGDNRPDLLVQGAGVQVLLNSQSFTSSFDSASITTALGSDTGIAIDTIAPVVTLALLSDTGVSASDGVTANPALQGQAEAFGTVTISQGGVTLGTTTASAAGAWSFTPSLASDGPVTLTASETDAAGNIGSASLAFTLDRQTPVVTLALAHDTGVSASDGITANPALVGTAMPTAASRSASRAPRSARLSPMARGCGVSRPMCWQAFMSSRPAKPTRPAIPAPPSCPSCCRTGRRDHHQPRHRYAAGRSRAQHHALHQRGRDRRRRHPDASRGTTAARRATWPRPRPRPASCSPPPSARARTSPTCW